jgi:hypothetical protein
MLNRLIIDTLICKYLHVKNIKDVQKCTYVNYINPWSLSHTFTGDTAYNNSYTSEINVSIDILKQTLYSIVSYLKCH